MAVWKRVDLDNAVDMAEEDLVAWVEVNGYELQKLEPDARRLPPQPYLRTVDPARFEREYAAYHAAGGETADRYRITSGAQVAAEGSLEEIDSWLKHYQVQVQRPSGPRTLHDNPGADMESNGRHETALERLPEDIFECWDAAAELKQHYEAMGNVEAASPLIEVAHLLKQAEVAARKAAHGAGLVANARRLRPPIGSSGKHRPAVGFDPGMTLATQGARSRFPVQFLQACFSRHMAGDWGEVTGSSARMNDREARKPAGGDILSVYRQGRDELWIKTEGQGENRVTTFLLPEEN